MIRDAAEPPLLEVADLSVRREREVLLAGVSFAVARGDLHVVVGPNGAGKSTLLAAVLGQAAFSGRITARWRRDGRIGYVPQSFAVDRTLPVTVADFLALTRQRRPVCLGVATGARPRIAALLASVGLEGLERRPLSVLSGGELRRVLLAHALDPPPELLVLDEPASGLDEAAARRLEELLLVLREARELTVLMVSHDLDQARRIADRVTVLDHRVVSDGTAAEALAGDLSATLFRGIGAAGARGAAR
ncbi:MAG TPA: metal ABC transporter ATP-binding protein [Thermoanaerobaculia bacterium]